jgi:hypothetical protein
MKRFKEIAVWLTPAEYNKIREVVESLGKTLSGWAREVLLREVERFLDKIKGQEA